jgi:SAM-dependent methyltransferase
MKWFAERGHTVTGVDRAVDALDAALAFGTVVLADIENGPWPLMDGCHVRRFDAVVVTNYLWRPLLPLICESVAPDGLLIYETFSKGHETAGRPARSDFLLQPAELLSAFACLRVIAFEEGFLEAPARFVQRIAAVKPGSRDAADMAPWRYAL